MNLFQQLIQRKQKRRRKQLKQQIYLLKLPMLITMKMISNHFFPIIRKHPKRPIMIMSIFETVYIHFQKNQSSPFKRYIIYHSIFLLFFSVAINIFVVCFVLFKVIIFNVFISRFVSRMSAHTGIKHIC